MANNPLLTYAKTIGTQVSTYVGLLAIAGGFGLHLAAPVANALPSMIAVLVGAIFTAADTKQWFPVASQIVQDGFSLVAASKSQNISNAAVAASESPTEGK